MIIKVRILLISNDLRFWLRTITMITTAFTHHFYDNKPPKASF